MHHGLRILLSLAPAALLLPSPAGASDSVPHSERPAAAALLDSAGLRAELSGDGLTLRARGASAAGWSFELALVGHGRGEALAPAADAELAQVGQRVELRRGGLVEWYVPCAAGIEQGFTLTERPTGDAGAALRLDMELRGSFRHGRVDGEDALVLIDPERDATLTYSGLVAWDATGRELDARLALAGEVVSILVDDEGASYPLTIDPIVAVQEGKLVPAAAVGGERIGYAVGISGDVAVVGARLDSEAASEAGAAWVFVRQGGVWNEADKLLAGDAGADDHFGSAVSVFGDVIAVGAPEWNTGLIGGDDAGQVYVFTRVGTTEWSQSAMLAGSDTDGGDFFGYSVQLDDHSLIVGAYGNDDAGNRSGSAYVFFRNGISWGEQVKLVASDASSGDFFGFSVAMDGDLAVVGAPGVSGDFVGTGAAYVFGRSGPVWRQLDILTPLVPGDFDQFGHDVDISGTTVVVSSPRDDDGGIDAGSVEVFERPDVLWESAGKLVPSDAMAFDGFGQSVGIEGNMLAVGAHQDDSKGPNAGSVYLFLGNGAGWSQEAEVGASDPGSSDAFGWALDFEDGRIVVGAYLDDAGSFDTGSGYVFEVTEALPGFPVCFGDGTGLPCPCGNTGAPGEGCVNLTGVGAILTASGSDVAAQDDFTLRATQANPNKNGVFLQGAALSPTPFRDGLLCLGNPTVRLQLVTANGVGTAVSTTSIVTAGGVLPGQTLWYQYWFRDGFGPCAQGSNLSNAFQVSWQ